VAIELCSFSGARREFFRKDPYGFARACGLTRLAAQRRHLGLVDVIKGIASANGYVKAVPEFRKATIVSGASEFLIEILVSGTNT
jgi:hypothetical protein